jgi:hypothetical protein
MYRIELAGAVAETSDDAPDDMCGAQPDPGQDDPDAAKERDYRIAPRRTLSR